MLHKGNMRTSDSFKLILLSMKAIMPVLLFSLGVMLVVVPIINYGNYKLLGISDELKTTLIHTARRLIPFACALPSVFMLRLFTETDAKEIMQIYLTNKRLYLTLFPALFYALISGVLFIIYSHYFEDMGLEFVKTVCVILFLYGIYYFIMAVSRSTAVTLLLMIVYEVFIIIDFSDIPVNYVMYSQGTLNPYEYWIYLALSGVVTSFIGEKLLRSIKLS